MKKALSLVLALMMLMSMCIIPVMAEEPEGSASNPYYVANPMMAPGFITIPANDAVYYQYNAAVFNGWSVSGYGLTSIVVDGVVFAEANMWGEIGASFNFNFMSPGIVAYVNDTAEEVQVMINHNQPVGTEDNPAQIEDGANALSIPASIMDYVTVYVPFSDGDFTFSVDQPEDFQVVAFADGMPSAGGTPIFAENGTLTLTLESYMPVYVIVTPMGMTGDVVLTVTPPKAGTESNPIWLDSYGMEDTYAVDGDLYFQVDGGLSGNTMNITSVAGAEFTALVDGVEYASEGGKLSIALDSGDWYIELVLSSAVANEIAFEIEYAPGTSENPLDMVLGDNAVSIPEGSNGMYYAYTAEADGLMIVTPSAVDGISYLAMANADYSSYTYLQAGAAAMMMPIAAGEVITLEIYSVEDEETWIAQALDVVLNVVVKDLVLYTDFESGELEGWGSSSNLSVDDVEYISGWYSAKFDVNQDWGNMFNYITLEPNTDYVITFKAKAALEKGLWVKFNKGWASDIAKASVNLTTEWADYEVTLNSGELGSTVLLLQHTGYGNEGQIVWVDDFVITKADAATPDQPEVEEEVAGNLFTNGTFEGGNHDGWSAYEGSHVSTDAAKNGSYGFNAIGKGGWGGMLSQTVYGIVPGNEYKLSFWIKAVTKGVNIQVKDESGENKYGSEAGAGWYDTNNYSEWTYVEKTFMAQYDTLHFLINGSGSGIAESVYVDSITLVCISGGEPVVYEPLAPNASLEISAETIENTKITGWEGAALKGEASIGLKEINGIPFLEVLRDCTENTEFVLNIDNRGYIGDNKYLVVYADFTNTEFRKASFGFKTSSGVYCTDNADGPCTPFYYLADGAAEWVTMNHGDDGCFGDAQNSAVYGLKGYFAVPVEDFLKGGNSIAADTVITGVYFYYSLSRNFDCTNVPFYFTDLKLATELATPEQPDVPAEPSFDGFIVNGDFETGDLTGWHDGYDSTISDTVAHGGKYSVYSTHTAKKYDLMLRQNGIAVKANTNYTLSFWYYYDGENADPSFYAYIKNGDANMKSITTHVAAPKTWAQVTLEFNTGDVEEILVLFQNRTAEDGGTYYFDDVKIVEEKDPSFDGYIYNGDFETGNLNSWTNLWNGCTVEFVAGKDSANAISITAGSWSQVRQDGIVVTPNTDYVLTAWVKNANNMGLIVKKGDDTGDINSVHIKECGDWTQYTVEFNSGDQTSVCVLLIGWDGGGSAIFDDVTLAEKPDTPDVPAEEEVAGNLFVNGTFEGGNADGWKTYQGSAATTDAAKNGSYGFNAIGNGGWGGMFNQTVAVEVGKTYTMSFWVKIVSNGVNIQVKDADGTKFDGSPAGWYSASNYSEWTYVEKTFVAHADSLTFNVCGAGNGTPESAYIDSITLVKEKDPSFDGYITNGDFETGKLGGWTNLWDSCTVEFVDGCESDYALSVVMPKQWQQVRQNLIPVEANTTYRLSADVKNAQNVSFVIKEGNDSFDLTPAEIGAFPAGEDWQKFTMEFNTGVDKNGDAVTVDSICVLIISYGENGGSVIIDNITLEKVEPAAAAGDANGDGKVNNRDLGVLQQFLNDWDVEVNEAACDVNGDGKVNNRDLGILQQYLNDWDVELG